MLGGAGEGMLLLKGSQALPARHSDKDRMEMKMLGW
jgi:hypothetical protein